MAEILFYLLAALALAFAAGVVTAKMPLYSVLSLLGVFVCLAGIYLLAGFQFLAATQLLVYAGAIMVLFLFVIMLLNLGDLNQFSESPAKAIGKTRFVIAGAAATVLCLVGVLAPGHAPAPVATLATREGGIDRLEPLAEVLFSRYMLPFEAASLLLLATMIAVIVLAKRQRGRIDENVGEKAGWPWQKGVEQ